MRFIRRRRRALADWRGGKGEGTNVFIMHEKTTQGKKGEKTIRFEKAASSGKGWRRTAGKKMMDDSEKESQKEETRKRRFHFTVACLWEKKKTLRSSCRGGRGGIREISVRK